MTEPVWFADAVGMAFILFWCLGGLYMLFCLFMASGLGDLLSWFTSDQGDPTQLIGMDVTATRRVLEEFGFRGPSWGMRSDEYPGVFVTLRQDESALEVDFGVIPYGQPREEDIEFVKRRAVLTFPTARDEVEPALSRIAELRSVYMKAGRWPQAAEEHGLDFLVADGLRRIEGEGIQVVQDLNSAVITARVPDRIRAVPGSGSSGNPVLDLLIDSQNVPDHAVEQVLEFVHGKGASIRDGEFRITLRGDLVDALAAVVPLVRALNEV